MMEAPDSSVRVALGIAVQDATDALRTSTLIATAASAAGLARFLATNDRAYLDAVKEGQHLITTAIATLEKVIALSQAYPREDRAPDPNAPESA